jgi:hypothetical protein
MDTAEAWQTSGRGPCRSAIGCSTRTPALPAPRQARPRDWIPAFAPSFPTAGGHTPYARILVCAPCVPVPTGPHGEPPAIAERLSLTVHQNASPPHDALRATPLQGGTRRTQPRNALAGRADLRDNQPQELLRLVRWVGAWHPLDLLEGYHTPARGQSQTTHTLVLSRAAPELPRGRAAPDRRDAMPAPACKIDSLGRRRAVGRREAVRNQEK